MPSTSILLSAHDLVWLARCAPGQCKLTNASGEAERGRGSIYSDELAAGLAALRFRLGCEHAPRSKAFSKVCW